MPESSRGSNPSQRVTPPVQAPKPSTLKGVPDTPPHFLLARSIFDLRNWPRRVNPIITSEMKFLQSPVFWIFIASAILVAFIVFRKRNSSAWGFKDLVKKPKHWDFLDQAQADVDSSVHAAKSWDDSQIASATRQFVLETTTGRDDWPLARALSELGEKTHPTILALLHDASLYERLVKPTGTDLLPEAPFNRACNLLGDSPGAEAVEAVAPFLNDPSDQIRKDAALVIAKTGANTAIPFVRKAFQDSDEYVRSYALMGLDFALNRAGLSESASIELFPDVLSLLRADLNADDAAKISYRLNPSKAGEFFLSEEVFQAESPILHSTLKVLADAKVSAPREKIKSLIAALEQQELEYPKTYALGEALRLLGQHQLEEDREFLLSRTTHSEERVAEGAAAGLICSFGLEGYDERIWKPETALTEHQRLYKAVFACDAEINNGGLAQYFVNSTGDGWRDALAGFKAMGFKERLRVLEEALANFGSVGPSEDRETRQNQLGKLYKRDDTIFEALDSRYYKSSEVVEVFGSRFVLANPQSFR